MENCDTAIRDRWGTHKDEFTCRAELPDDPTPLYVPDVDRSSSGGLGRTSDINFTSARQGMGAPFGLAYAAHASYQIHSLHPHRPRQRQHIDPRRAGPAQHAGTFFDRGARGQHVVDHQHAFARDIDLAPHPERAPDILRPLDARPVALGRRAAAADQQVGDQDRAGMSLAAPGGAGGVRQ
jgi:hypothetical protein